MAASRAGRRRWSPRAHSLPAGHTTGFLPSDCGGLACRVPLLLPLPPLPRGARGGVGSRSIRRRRITLLRRCGRTSAASATITAGIRATARRAGHGRCRSLTLWEDRSSRELNPLLTKRNRAGHLTMPRPVVNQRDQRASSIRPRAWPSAAGARSSRASRRRAKGRSNQWRGRFRGRGRGRRSRGSRRPESWPYGC